MTTRMVAYEHQTARLRRDLRRLFKRMDFVSSHPSLTRGGREAARFAEIYQQLGLAWEFLALQCKHRDGWRKVRDGNTACKICGLIRGNKEPWLLLPRTRAKTIGRRSLPNSKKTFPNRKPATVVNDTINFDGATLNVEVLNQQQGNSLFGKLVGWSSPVLRLAAQFGFQGGIGQTTRLVRRQRALRISDIAVNICEA